MNGRINMYNDGKGFGFIICENDESFYFHISDVKSSEKPFDGAIVEFESEQSEKGLMAKNVYIQKEKQRPAFIKFGDTRIKVSNIKNYGMSTRIEYCEKIYEKVKHHQSKLKELFMGAHIDYEYKGFNEKIDSNRAHELINDFCFRKVYFKKGDDVPELVIAKTQRWRKKIYHNSRNFIDIINRQAEPEDLIIENKKHLYITTFQNENFEFFENEFDIIEKCNELDNYLI